MKLIYRHICFRRSHREAASRPSELWSQFLRTLCSRVYSGTRALLLAGARNSSILALDVRPDDVRGETPVWNWRETASKRMTMLDDGGPAGCKR